MFDKLFRQHKRLSVDLDSIGDTLRYIESDVSGSPQYTKLHAAIKAALHEVERLEVQDDKPASANQPALSAKHHMDFVPLIND